MTDEIAVYFFDYDKLADYWWWAKRPHEYKFSVFNRETERREEKIVQMKDGLNDMPKKFRDAVLLLATMD